MTEQTHIVLAVALAMVVAGCASTPVKDVSVPAPAGQKYAEEVPLSPALVASDDGAIAVHVPKGWSRASSDETFTDILLWLVNEDYSASITFVPIQMDPALYQALRRDGLPAVTKVSMSLKEGNLEKPMQIVQAPEAFDLNGRPFYAYEYSANNKATIVRVAVFDTGSRFIECACVPAAEQVTPAVQRALFHTQQAVLASMVLQ